jgi:Cu(I)/Ag(I) efflux system membrane fusion protein
MVFLVTLARLRFLVVLGAIGFVIVKWDDLLAHYDKWTRHAVAEVAADTDHEFFCPMHPTIVRADNKEKCPICFMPLSKRKIGEAIDETLPAGVTSRVQLSPYRVVLAGAQTLPVSYVPLTKEITTVGTVEFNERGLKTVSARVKGRIDTLVVNQTGQMVHKGDPLALLYSPDLVVTVQNLLDARNAANRDLEQSARERLKLWGIDDAQIEKIVKTGKPVTQLTIRSPIDGHVLRKYPREGQYVEEGGPLFDLADLSTVWVQAQLYEDDLAFLPPGGHDPKTGLPDRKVPVIATTRAFPGRAFVGTLSFLFPHVDPDSRTLTVRFELGNADHELRPGMSAAVVLKVSPDLLSETPAGAKLQKSAGGVLAVPEPSVIDTGRLKVVYRETLPNTFDGVTVELGSRMSGPGGAAYYPVLSGLTAGDKVVTAGSFLIDAETRLNPAIGSIFIGGGGSKSGASGAMIRPTTPVDEEAKVSATLATLPHDDRKLVEAQRTCPILDGSRLGAMGVPVKVTLDGGTAFVCCKACVKQALADRKATLDKVAELRALSAKPVAATPPDKVEKIRAALGKLPPDDRKLAEAQKTCPITNELLGSMGMPVKVLMSGQPVFGCCKACEEELLADPAETLKKVGRLKSQAVPK